MIQRSGTDQERSDAVRASLYHGRRQETRIADRSGEVGGRRPSHRLSQDAYLVNVDFQS